MLGSAKGVAAAAFVAGVLAAGCGKGDAGGGGGSHSDARTDSSTGAAADSAPSLPGGIPGAADLQNSAADAARSLQQLNGGKEIKAVAPAALKALLPAEIAGAKRANVESTHMNQMGLDIATTTCNFEPVADENDDGSHPKPSFHVTITDVGNASGAMAMGLTAWTMAEFERDTDTGYEKMTKYRGLPCEERYDREAKDGSMKVYVAKRFIVEVSGSNASIEEIKAALDALDTAKLEALVK